MAGLMTAAIDPMAAAAGSAAFCNRNIAFEPVPCNVANSALAALMPFGLNSEMIGILIAINNQISVDFRHYIADQVNHSALNLYCI